MSIFLMAMPALDIIVVLTAVAGLILGYRKGMVRQLGSLVAFMLAVIVCRMCGSEVAEFVGASVFHVDMSDQTYSSPTAAAMRILGYGIVFVAAWFAVWLLARLLHAVVQAVRLGTLNSMLGSVFACLKFLTVLSLILNVWQLVAPCSGWMATRGALSDMTLGIAPALLGMMTNG